jgi:signal transduction histidine kinase
MVLGNETVGSSTSARFFIGALVVLVSIGLLGLGVLLSNTYGASQVAESARKLHWVNATMGAAGIARAAVAQAVVFSFEDVSDAEGKEGAIEEARENLDGVEALVGSPDAFDEVGSLRQFLEAGNATVDLAQRGDSSFAEATRLETVEPVFQELEADLLGRQSDLAGEIARSDEIGGRISRLTFVAISFAIPAVTMIVFWLLLRRRVRDREQLMLARLEAEKDLSRAKDQFIAGLSHELRTPLTSIVGFSEILVQDADLDEDGREQLAIIHASSSDLARMVADLLVAGRLEAGALTVSPEVIDLAATVKSAIGSYVLAGEDIKMRVPPIEVYADPLHLRQIIHNLVSNALRHGGDSILITASEQAGSASLIVADDGPGVSAELEPRLFEKFMHEGKQALLAGSVGLGLAISQELARLMNGVISYKRVGKWTTLILKVPSAPKPERGTTQHELVLARNSI